jgi:hypothetical protein
LERKQQQPDHDCIMLAVNEPMQVSIGALEHWSPRQRQPRRTSGWLTGKEENDDGVWTAVLLLF